jgi:hypothetical protein
MVAHEHCWILFLWACNVLPALVVAHHLPRRNEEWVAGMRALKEWPKTGSGTMKPLGNVGVHFLWGMSGAKVDGIATGA